MQLTNIDASLSHGKFLSWRHIAFLCFGIALFLLFPILTVILLITSVQWNSQMIVSLSASNIIFMLYSFFSIYLIIKNDKLKKKIILWLDDAIETKAYSKNIGGNRLGFQPKATKIQVKFTVDNKTYIRESTGKTIGGWEGYLGVYAKYANKEINILYSKKHDEVLILKNK